MSRPIPEFLERATHDDIDRLPLSCDVVSCFESEIQDIVEAPVDQSWGTPLRPIFWDRRDPEYHYRVCQKCIDRGFFDEETANA